MDGRVQLPVIRWIQTNYNSKYVDMITEAGPDKILSNKKNTLGESIKKRAIISVKKHGSMHIVIIGHYDCAGNPVTKLKHIQQIKKAIDNVIAWDLNVSVHGLWLNKNWNIETV